MAKSSIEKDHTNSSTFQEDSLYNYSSSYALSLLLDYTDEMIILLNRDLKILLFNKAVEKATQKQSKIKPVKGMSVFELTPVHLHDKVRKNFEEVLKGNIVTYEDKLLRPDGNIEYFTSTLKPVYNDTGGIESIITITRDFTERKNEIQQLKESEQRLRLAMEGSNHGMWDWNIITGETYYSDSYKRMYGYFDEEMTNNISEWEKRIHPDDKEMIDKALHDHFNGPDAYHEVTYRLKDKWGNYRWVMARAIINDRDAEGKPVRMIGTHTDITEQKQKDESYKLLFYNHPLPMWIYDLETLEILEVNEASIKQYGYSREEFLNFKVTDVRPEEDVPAFLEMIAAVKAGNPNEKTIVRHRKKNGDLLYAEVTGEYLMYEGRNCRMLSVSDITETILAQKELQKSNERFRIVTKATSDAIYETNLITQQIFWGDNLYSLFGYRPNEITFENWDSLVHTDHRKRVNQSLQEAFKDKSQTYWKEEYPLLTKSGSYRFVLDRGFIIRDEKGEAIQMIGAIQDITDEKEYEQQLLESNARFDAVMNATHDLIWDWNLETGEFYRDQQGATKVYGLEDVSQIKDFNTWMERIHPEDHDRVQKVVTDFLHATKENTFDVEYRFKKDDGTYSYVYDRGILIRNEEGKPIRMVGAAQNITERKKLELELLHKELDKQKLISKATIETQEIERGEIGKELHDNVNQVLTTTKLYMDLALSNPEMKDELIEKSNKNIIYVINEIRQLSRSLMNPSLGDLGLMESLTDLIEDINATRKLIVVLKTEDDIEELLSDNSKLMMYRIVQEALNNALKHANAGKALVSITRTNGNCFLKIEDDGVGFDVNHIKKGSGLKNIQNRVYLANGSLIIKSAPLKGSTLEITLPLNTQ